MSSLVVVRMLIAFVGRFVRLSRSFSSLSDRIRSRKKVLIRSPKGSQISAPAALEREVREPEVTPIDSCLNCDGVYLCADCADAEYEQWEAERYQRDVAAYAVAVIAEDIEAAWEDHRAHLDPIWVAQDCAEAWEEYGQELLNTRIRAAQESQEQIAEFRGQKPASIVQDDGLPVIIDPRLREMPSMHPAKVRRRQRLVRGRRRQDHGTRGNSGKAQTVRVHDDKYPDFVYKLKFYREKTESKPQLWMPRGEDDSISCTVCNETRLKKRYADKTLEQQYGAEELRRRHAFIDCDGIWMPAYDPFDENDVSYTEPVEQDDDPEEEPDWIERRS